MNKFETWVILLDRWRRLRLDCKDSPRPREHYREFPRAPRARHTPILKQSRNKWRFNISVEIFRNIIEFITYNTWKKSLFFLCWLTINKNSSISCNSIFISFVCNFNPHCIKSSYGPFIKHFRTQYQCVPVV